MRKYPRKTTQSLASRCKALCVQLLPHPSVNVFKKLYVSHYLMKISDRNCIKNISRQNIALNKIQALSCDITAE
ncbi:hypothetical protein YJ60_004192, partial [Salmonella enterica subsp. enterica]|nr:hypothetical protein [Salmonella enterica subsp. enterica]